MGKRIFRKQHVTDEEALRDRAIRAEFGHRPGKSDLAVTGKYVGPMSIEEYLAWRRDQVDAPLAKQLREAVRSCGQAVSAIAEAAGVPQPVLQRFVSGQRGITLDTAGRLAAYLKLSLLPDPVGKK